MRQLWSLLAVAALLGGAQGLAAQQPMHSDTMRVHHTALRTRHHMTTHRARSTHMATRHARTTHMTAHHERTMHARRVRHVRTSTVMRTRPMPVGREVGYPSGRGPGTRYARLSNGLITPDAARMIALRAVPGGTSVSKYKLHAEDGRQVYDVKVVTPNQAGNEQVRIDALTGAVLRTTNVDNPVGTVKSKVSGLVHRVKH